jgi:hypothetical protein
MVRPWRADLRGRVRHFVDRQLGTRDHPGRRWKLGVPGLHTQQEQQVKTRLQTEILLDFNLRLFR